MRMAVSIVAVCFLIGGSTSGRASELSERLVARGEVAYQAGDHDQARALFTEAVEADPDDAVARYHLGLALGRLDRWADAADAFQQALRLRPEFDEAAQALDFARARAREAETATPAEARRWQLRATTGIEYDTNVKVAPGGRFASSVGEKGDVAFIFGGGGQYDLVRRPDTLVRLEYDLYQTLHPDISDFDFRAHTVRGTVSHQFVPNLWAGVQGGYNHYTLGPHSYESEPFVTPFGSLLEGERGVTQLNYRHGEATYLSAPFHDVRDGPNDAVMLSQTINFGPRALTAGYIWGEERPRSTAGDDYRFTTNQGFVGIELPAWWQTEVDLTYLFRYDDYSEPNSQVDFRTRRYDRASEFYASITRPIVEHVDLAVVYYGTFNGSNISEFEYNRNIISAVLQITY